MTQLTKQQILEETYNYYTEDVKRRAVGPRGCLYTYILDNGTKKHCAVGRCFKPEFQEKDLDSTLFTDPSNTSCMSLKDLESLLQDKYKGHELRFWRDLQFFHDTNGYWDSSLTDIGQIYYDSLVKKWCS
jgi:hypothetical protein